MADEPTDPAEAGQVDVPEFDARRELGETVEVVERRRELSAWHRPRKQYVRTRQWSASLKDLLASQETDEPIRYLGLPGDEFLDVRHLASDAVEGTGREIRFLGFNDGVEDGIVSLDPIGRVTSEDEVRRRSGVDSEGSRVMPDDIRRLSAPDSPAHKAAKSMGPFDVVNLDLCQSFFCTPPGTKESYTGALRQIMGIQGRAGGEWLLWITTRVNRETVNEATAEKLLEIVRQRFADCAYVADDWAAVFESSSPDEMELATCSDDDFASLVFVGLAVWVLALAAGPVKHSVNITSNFSYRIRTEPPATPDMHSMVFRFSPQTPVPDDYSGLTTKAAEAEGPDKCQKLEHIINRLASTINIDERVKSEAGLRDELIDGTAALLEEARVERRFYVEWVAQFAS